MVIVFAYCKTCVWIFKGCHDRPASFLDKLSFWANDRRGIRPAISVCMAHSIPKHLPVDLRPTQLASLMQYSVLTPRSFILLLSLCIFACFPSLAVAKDWAIPLQGNAYRTEGSGRRSPIGRDGTMRLNAREKVSVFVHFRAPGKVEFSLAVAADSDSKLRLANRDSILESDVSASREFQSVSLGPFEVMNGYQRFEFSLPPETETYVSVRNVVIHSDNREQDLTYVKSNDGNMFYWGRRGPSVHLRYEVPSQRLSYAYTEVTVPDNNDVLGSFFMANGFGQGYFGFQVNGPSERRVLFSVWSPYKTDNPRDIPEDQRVEALARGADVRIGEFGNEGSGGQSFLIFPWQSGKPYRFLTKVAPGKDGSTTYTSWFGVPTSANANKTPGTEWRLIASFRRPKTETNLTGFHSFLENFQPSTGHLQRQVHFGNVWVCDLEGTWHECTRARFSVDATGGGGHRLDFAGGSKEETFFLKNCGFFSETGKPGERFKRNASKQPPKINFDELPMK